jgi:zinc protease
MKKQIIKSLLVTLLILPSFITSQAQQAKVAKQQQKEQLDRSVRPNPGPAPVINIGKYETFTLDNGLQVFVVENNKIPRVTYSLILDYTPVQEGNVAGLADLTGQMLRTGTTTLSKEQLDEEVDFIGASLSTYSTGMYGSGLKKHNEKLLQLMSEVLLNPSFNEEELAKLTTRTISALQTAKDEPSEISDRVTRKLLYGENHPYGEAMIEKTVKNINTDMCKAFYSTYFRPQISYLAVVGDITPEEAKVAVEKYFGKWQRTEVKTEELPVPPVPSSPVVAISDRPDAVQTTLSIGYPVQLKPGSDDAIKARVTNTILGGGTFRLYDNLREKHGFTYGAYSRLSADKYVGNFQASTEIRNSVTDSALNEILSEMKRIREEQVGQTELSLVKNYIAGGFALSLENPQTVANFAINTARYKLPADYYVNYLKNIAAVSSEDVKAMAQKYILPGNTYIVAVGKASEIVPKLQPFAGTKPIRYFDFEGKEYDPSKKVKAAPAGMTAEDVITGYVNAIGGAKVLGKVKDVAMNATTTMQGMTIGFDIFRKAPDKYMMKIGAGDMVFQQITFNGTDGSMYSPMGGENKKMEGEELENMKLEAQLFPELNYAKNGVKLQLEGIETLESGEAFKVIVTNPTGKQSTRYFDTKTNLLIKEINEEGTAELSDYREVSKIKFPFKIKQSMGPQTIDLNVLSIKVNSKLSDDLFILK